MKDRSAKRRDAKQARPARARAYPEGHARNPLYSNGPITMTDNTDLRPMTTTPNQTTRERAALFMRHDGLCGIVGGYRECTCGMEEARAALQSPTDREGDRREWRPIESAPKDGTPILAFGPLPGCNADDHGWHGVRETKWKCYPKGSPGYAAYERGEGPLGIGWDWYESVHNWSHSWKPTHWMPLPEAPAHLSRSIVGEGK